MDHRDSDQGSDVGDVSDQRDQQSGAGGAEFSDALSAGDVVADRYEVIERLGDGGMGSVFQVEDLELYEMVALKVLHREAADSREAVEQFRREVRLARRVTHRNVVRTYDIGIAGGVPFLTMEYIEGQALRDWIGSPKLETDKIVAVVRDICAGLVEAHRADVVHRDLKPENVLVSDTGRVAITDFGIAGALRSADDSSQMNQQHVGTPAYMAPEQVRADPQVDHRLDIYAVGLLLFEMLTGRLPWQESDPIALAVARVEQPSPQIGDFADGLAPGLVSLVDACLTRDPSGRPGHMGEVLSRLDRFVEGRPTRRNLSMPTLRATSSAPNPTADTQPMGMQPAAGLANASSTVHQPQAEATEPLSVAVLPFGCDGVESDAHIGPGLHDDLVYRLAHWPGLEVRLRQGGDWPTAETQNPLEVARKLGVDLAVHGEIAMHDEHVDARIGVVSRREGAQIWGESKHVPRDALPQLGRRVADEIAAGLDLEEPPSRNLPTELDSAASSLLMQGQHLLRESWFQEVEPAIKPLEKALQRAPDHPRPLAQLAIARARQGYLNPSEHDERIGEAVELARRSIDRASDLWAEPRYALAMAHFFGNRYDRAVATLQATLARDDDYAEAHELYGRILLEIGPLERAITHLERAIELNPYLYRARWDLVRGYGLRSEWRAAAELASRPVDSQQHKTARAMVAARLSLWNREPILGHIWRSERQVLESAPGLQQIVAVLDGGDFDEQTRRQLAEMTRDHADHSRRTSLFYQAVAEMAAYTDHWDSALQFIDEAIDAGLTDVVWMRRCPVFDPVRDRPAFADLLARLVERVDSLQNID